VKLTTLLARSDALHAALREAVGPLDDVPMAERADLPGFFVPMISRKMAPNPRGAHEEEPIH
jgi:hypothetical protein